jgi:hypothetical protein
LTEFLFSAAPDAVVATKFYLSLIQSTLRKLLFFSVAPVLLLVATKYYGFSSGQLLAGWLGGWVAAGRIFPWSSS